jgi:hypothetical protein
MINLIEGMQPKGTLGDWQRVMTMLCNRNQYDVVTLALIGFASPLMGWNNNGAAAMVFHACSAESGVGKSLALDLARSVWGGKRLAVVPKTSENTMLQRAGLLGGLPLFVDEVTTKNRESESEWMSRFIFDYAQGQHKLKGSSSANAELNDNMTWSGLSFLTSNSPVLEYLLSSRRTTANGEVQRFLEWRTETKLQFTDAERTILPLLNENYGHAGPAFAEWLVKNLAAAKAVFAKVLERWRLEINADDSERYWVASGTALITAATLLGPKYSNIAPINVKRVVQFLHGLVSNARRLIKNNITTAADLLASFLSEFNNQFVRVGPVGRLAASLINSGPNVILPESARGPVIGRIEIDVSPGRTDTFIALKALKSYCGDFNWAYDDLVAGLSKLAVVKEKSVDLLAGTPTSRSLTSCLHIAQATKAPSVAIP